MIKVTTCNHFHVFQHKTFRLPLELWTDKKQSNISHSFYHCWCLLFLPLKLNFHKNCCISCFNKELKTNKNNWATIIPFISFYYTGIYIVFHLRGCCRGNLKRRRRLVPNSWVIFWGGPMACPSGLVIHFTH